MTMEVYWVSGRPFSWRVLLTLEVKRVPYVSKRLEFSKGELKTPQFLAMSPRGKVPVIKEDDFVLTESLAIMAYLDKLHTETPLFGRNARETGQVWRVI